MLESSEVEGGGVAATVRLTYFSAVGSLEEGEEEVQHSKKIKL